MKKRNRSGWEIQTVDVLSRGEQVAFVLTPRGGYIVGSIPDAGTDASEAGILASAPTLEEAQSWFRHNYGMN